MIYELKPLKNYVELTQGLAINAGTAHLVSDKKTDLFAYPLLRIADMLDNSYEKFVSTKVQRNVIASPNDIIYTRTGQIGLAFSGKTGVVHNNSFIVKVTNDELLKEYLYVVLQTSFVREQALKLAKNSVQPDLTHDMFKSIVVPIPSQAIQKKIADFYIQIESKIYNLAGINDNLQQLAYDIYMHLFFKKQPNGTLGEIIVEHEKSSVQVGEAKGKSANYPFFTSGDAILEWDDAMVDGRNCFLNTGGNAGVKFYIGNAAYSTDTWCITANRELEDYLYLLLLSIKPELDQKFFQGTGLKHLQKPLLKERMIYIPSEKEIAEFNAKAKPLMDMISANVRENKKLIALRDWLLPMLMNGQATVSD